MACGASWLHSRPAVSFAAPPLATVSLPTVSFAALPLACAPAAVAPVSQRLAYRPAAVAQPVAPAWEAQRAVASSVQNTHTLHSAGSAERQGQREEALQALLGALAAKGFFAGLPADAQGALRVGLPFCETLSEAPVLLPLLVKYACPGGSVGLSAIVASGGDVKPQSQAWSHWAQWAAHQFGPKLQLDLRQQDLSQAPPEPAALIIGAHPESSRVGQYGPWDSILRNVLGSLVPGGRALFATYFPNEAEILRGLVVSIGLQCEVFQNPYYTGFQQASGPLKDFGSFRHAVVVRR